MNFTEQEIFNDASDLNNLVKKIRKHSIIFSNIQRHGIAYFYPLWLSEQSV